MGLFDIHVAVLLSAVALGVEVPFGVIIVTAVLLLAKAFIDITDIGGLTDMAGSVLIILTFFFAIPPAVLFVAAVIIGFKGLSSLAA